MHKLCRCNYSCVLLRFAGVHLLAYYLNSNRVLYRQKHNSAEMTCHDDWHIPFAQLVYDIDTRPFLSSPAPSIKRKEKCWLCQTRYLHGHYQCLWPCDLHMYVWERAERQILQKLYTYVEYINIDLLYIQTCQLGRGKMQAKDSCFEEGNAISSYSKVKTTG